MPSLQLACGHLLALLLTIYVAWDHFHPWVRRMLKGALYVIVGIGALAVMVWPSKGKAGTDAQASAQHRGAA